MSINDPAPAAAFTTPCVSVIIPAYDEAGTIAEVIRGALAQALVHEIIVVDDGSRDGTAAELQALAAQHPRVRVFSHAINRGKGAALRTGFAQASAPIVLVQDADLEYDPQGYATLVGPILGGRADVVYGSRFLGAGPHRVLYYWHRVGNAIVTTFSNICTNINLSDMETGHKAFRREIIQSLTIEEDRFGVEPEITAKLARVQGVRFYEVAVSYFGRTYAEGKKITWRDGIVALWCIAKYNWLARR